MGRWGRWGVAFRDVSVIEPLYFRYTMSCTHKDQNAD
jgi:hypothetical protein